MLQTIRRSAILPRVPSLAVLGSTAALAFGWLLISDSIQPVVVYLLQLYLAF